MFPDRPSPAESWPLEHLIATLLRQFKRPLAAQGVTLTDADAQAVARAVTTDAPDERLAAVTPALAAVIAESETVLRQWGLTFRQSLQTGVDALPGWHSTADFLALAEAKTNAEIRIGAGAALLAALDDLRYAGYLFDQLEAAPDEVESILARRALLFRSGLQADAPDWLAQARAWAEGQR